MQTKPFIIVFYFLLDYIVRTHSMILSFIYCNLEIIHSIFNTYIELSDGLIFEKPLK